MTSWQNSLEYTPGETYASVRARAMARLYRLANVGGPTATARAHELLQALGNANAYFNSGRRAAARSRSSRRGALWPWSRRRS